MSRAILHLEAVGRREAILEETLQVLATARLAAMTEVAREKFGLIQGWLGSIETTFDEIVKSIEKMGKEIEDLPSSKTITIKIKYITEGAPPAQRGGIVAPNLPRGTPVPVIAHAGEAFLGWPYNPAWASRAVPGPSAVAGSTVVHRTTNVSQQWSFGPTSIHNGMDLAVLGAYIKRTITDELR